MLVTFCDFNAQETSLLEPKGRRVGGGGAWASFTVYSYTLCLENTLPLIVSPSPEMEFLDNNLKKDSSLLLHAIHSLSTGGRIFKENQILVLKIHSKNPRNKKT